MTAAGIDEYRIGRREFDGFRRLIRDVSGIALGESKDALLVARVGRRMRALNLTEYADYLALVEEDTTGTEVCQLIDAISTNVTSFFREPQHFDTLAERLRQLANTRRGDPVLWSAACSTGEEPYSMAMVAARALSESGGRARILATDISGDALCTARVARYDAAKTASVPDDLASSFMRRAADGSVGIVPKIKSTVTFARINLSAPPFPMKGPFDVIMCRNVMIYFDKATRQRLVAELERLLAPGGLVMLGHSESLAGIQSSLRAVQPAVYEKPGPAS